ncbi:MAG TPA: ureidoglycolate lyase [Pyrinomonadaceae bacterium]|jgi:ureidoglycolate hydrolase|nr:ureidoglycolate lyase [Pyrinomonadaceae bacterium]
MKVIRLPVQKMTREAFAPYGVLIDSRGSVEIDLGQGTPSLTGATSERRPFRFDFMARHRFTMQVFSPLASSQAIVCVAPPNGLHVPDIERVAAFIVEGRLPYAYHRGTWHTPPFSVGEWYSYLVVDRSGTLDDDYELVDLKATRDCAFEIEVAEGKSK